MHNVIFTTQAPRGPRLNGDKLNISHKSWQTAADYLESFAPLYSTASNGWIVSLMDGVGGVSKAVAYITAHGQPYNLVAVEKDKDQWEACGSELAKLIDREQAKVHSFCLTCS